MKKLASTLTRSFKSRKEKPIVDTRTGKRRKKKKSGLFDDDNVNFEEPKSPKVVAPPRGPPPSMKNKRRKPPPKTPVLDPVDDLNADDLKFVDSDEAYDLRTLLLGKEGRVGDCVLYKGVLDFNELELPGYLEVLEYLKVNDYYLKLIGGRITKLPNHSRWRLFSGNNKLYWTRVLCADEFQYLKNLMNSVGGQSSESLRDCLKENFDFNDSDYEALAINTNDLKHHVIGLEFQSWLLLSRGFLIDLSSGIPSFSWAGAFRCKPKKLYKYGLDDLHLTAEELIDLQDEGFETRVAWLRSHFKTMTFEDAEKGPLKISIERDNVLGTIANVFNSLHEYDRWRIAKYSFVGEPALDAGGVAKEVFRIVSEALYQEQFGLFIRCGGSDAELSYDINPLSGMLQPDRHLLYFRFAGRFLARALLEGCFINVAISQVLYKQILRRPISYHDLRFVDKQVYSSIVYLIEEASAEDLEALDQRFVVSVDNFGEIKEIELCKNGVERVVTKKNMMQYVYLLTKYYVHDRYKPQLYNFIQGFHSILPYHMFYCFKVVDFEKLVVGESKIDLEDFKNHVQYAAKFEEEGSNHRVIQWFWEILEKEFSNEERRKLLQFFTGSSRLPVGGFAALHQGIEERKIVFKGISKNVSVFPRGHTCFNHLDIPLYDTKEELESRLREVIGFNIGFNMD